MRYFPGALFCLWGLGLFAGEPFPIRPGGGEHKIASYSQNGFTTFVTVDLNLIPIYNDPDLPVHISKEGEGPAFRQRVQRTRGALVASIRQARENRLALCLRADEVKFPAPIRKYLLQHAPDPRNPHRVDLESELFWKFYRSKYREVLSLLPRDVKYIMIQTGEVKSSPLDDHQGHTVFDGKYDSRYVWMMSQLIRETHKLVAVEGKRILIWRTWDPRRDGFHSNPSVYDRVVSALPNHAGLLFSMKYLQGDFWMYSNPNPCIGRGSVRQIVEFQTSREYEGKGAFPNYLGVEHAAAIRSARSTGIVDGIWCWGRQQGGAGGPEVANDLWRRMNLETTMALVHDPRRTPEEVLLEWLGKNFGSKSSKHLLPVFMKSRDCVKWTFYISAYAEKHKDWMPNRNLVRDDLIRGDRVMGNEGGLPLIYEDVKDSLSDVFQEKRDAVTLAYELRELFEYEKDAIVQARGQQVYDDALTGFIYLQKLSTVMCHYIRGMFLFYQWLGNQQSECAKASEQELHAWKEAWDDFQTEIPKLPAAPSLFRSLCAQDFASDRGAMADTCERALQKLTQR